MPQWKDLHNLEERYVLVQQTILNDLLIVQDNVNATTSNLPTCECTETKEVLITSIHKIENEQKLVTNIVANFTTKLDELDILC